MHITSFRTILQKYENDGLFCCTCKADLISGAITSGHNKFPHRVPLASMLQRHSVSLITSTCNRLYALPNAPVAQMLFCPTRLPVLAVPLFAPPVQPQSVSAVL